MKKKLLFTLALFWCTLLCFSQTFTDNGIKYTVTSNISPLTVKVSDNGGITGVINIAATVRYNNNTYSVTSIEDFAFISCIGLTSVTMPNSVTRIGYAAFTDCTGLASITFSNSLASIAQDAFKNCTSLTSVIIPNSVTTLGAGAFYNCSGLTSINIPNSVISIGDAAFYNCAGLTSVILPNAITNINSGLFYNCSSLTSITIPNSVTNIGIYAFSGCTGLTSVIIPNLVTNIGDNAFENCIALTSVTVNRTTPLSINANVFQGVTLSNVALNVPAGTAAIYAIAAVWSGFSPIRTQCTTSTTWNGSGWSNGVPTASIAAIFSGNFTAAADLTACSISVTGTAVVSFPSNFNLTIKNGIIVGVSSTLTFESNSNLIQINAATNTGNIVYKRNAQMNRLDYVFWSSPVANQNLLTFTPNTVINRFYTFSEPTKSYLQVASPSTANFGVAKGYSLRAPNNFFNRPAPSQTFVGIYTGVPNNGNIAVPVTTTASPTGAVGFNLIGNPYPSTINATRFLQDNTGAAYFWTHQSYFVGTTLVNGGAANYATFSLAGAVASSVSGTTNVTPNGFIQAGQGFMFLTATNKNVTFTNIMREANNAGQFFRTAQQTESDKIWLNLTNNEGAFSQSMIAYLPNTSTSFDDGYDALQMNTTGNVLSSKIADANYAIQSRGNFAGTDVVKLNLNIAIAGNYTLTKDSTNGIFTSAQDFFLKDNLTGTTHNIKQTPYNFVSTAGETADRFEIVYQNATLSNANNIFENGNVIVFEQNGNLNISATTELKNVKIFDIQGRNIFEAKDINAKATILNGFRPQQQVLLIQITNNQNQIVTKKTIF